VFPEKLLDAVILHLGSGGDAKVLAALGASLSADKFRNEPVNIFDVHAFVFKRYHHVGAGVIPVSAQISGLIPLMKLI
jgi:hypothetical protein